MAIGLLVVKMELLASPGQEWFEKARNAQIIRRVWPFAFAA
jgi:hypothetical protein